MMKIITRQLQIFSIIVLLAVLQAFPGCKTNKVSQSSKEEPLKEIMPGLLQGYLSKEEIPNSLALVPPPPEEGTVAFALDQEYAKKAVESKDTARFILATSDAELNFPAAAKSFESTLGIEISETKTPKLYVLMRRVLTDAALSTYTAKIITNANGHSWSITLRYARLLIQRFFEKMALILPAIQL
jgi:acid phosphatase (class A)